MSVSKGVTEWYKNIDVFFPKDIKISNWIVIFTSLSSAEGSVQAQLRVKAMLWRQTGELLVLHIFFQIENISGNKIKRIEKIN